jgi:cystathionine beta-synthase
MSDDRQVDVIARMREHGISQLPVVDGDGRLTGIVSEVELLEHMLASGHEHSPDETIADLINYGVTAAHQEEPFERILPDLMDTKVVVLVDDLQLPVGIVTMIDALEFIASGRMG